MTVKIEPSWQKHLAEEFNKNYFKKLAAFVKEEYQSKTIYPPPKEILKAFDLCPFEKVKVVILGQDPYHGPNQANGLCFSVHENIAIPPSLKNIFQEINNDLGTPQPKSGDLTKWAKQGVLLLNATLTVQAHQAGSHQKKGWEEFTDQAIAHLANERKNFVFILWGSYAQQKGALIDSKKHLILKAPHPSPLSAHRGFFGCKHFSKANAYLTQNGQGPIDWQL